jgi:trans-2,3-dihydro-3-hydroxyanthranilate isomerase
VRIDISWWDLDGSAQTIDSLMSHLRDEAVRAWADVPGLRLKFWMADRVRNRWGAVMIWEHDRPAGQSLPPNRAAELIGWPPQHRLRFEMEAAVEGRHSGPVLHGLGAALSPHSDPEPCTHM